MSENLKRLSPTERLRHHLLHQAVEATVLKHRQDWTPVGKAQGIASGMPIIYGLLKGLGSGRPEIRQWAKQTLEKHAEDYGFGSSIDKLKIALNDLREQLRAELPEKDWEIYFGRSLNVV